LTSELKQHQRIDTGHTAIVASCFKYGKPPVYAHIEHILLRILATALCSIQTIYEPF
jgi:hypothetical protein